MEACSLNCWTAREVPRMALLIIVEAEDMKCVCGGGAGEAINYIILLLYIFGFFHNKIIKYFLTFP